MKKWLAGIWLFGLMVFIGGVFWYNQFVYSLPTPVPAAYKSVAKGKMIDLQLPLSLDKKKPVFLHFFNPDCPCSRFNVKEFKALVKRYHGEMNFVVVMMTDKPYSEQQIKERFGLTIPVIKDFNIAEACGVYSTPQAVVLKASQELYYRGNYNVTRYCTDEKTNYAKFAIEGVLHNDEIKFEPYALKAYGCSLPNCSS